jgi:hypothetical protein
MQKYVAYGIKFDQNQTLQSLIGYIDKNINMYNIKLILVEMS